MATAAGGKSAKKNAKSDDEKPDDEKSPAVDPKGEGDDAGAGDDADGSKAPSKKKERTYSKAEQDAAIAKAVADAKKKFEEEKDLSELERLQKENEDLRSANRLREAKDAVVEALSKAGARSPELLYKSIKGDLEFDDKGGLKNLETLVTGLKSDYEDMFGTPKPEDGIDAGKGQSGPTTALTEEKLKSMTPEQINELPWEDVSKVLAGTK